jgi:hypothetical protein
MDYQEFLVIKDVDISLLKTGMANIEDIKLMSVDGLRSDLQTEYSKHKYMNIDDGRYGLFFSYVDYMNRPKGGCIQVLGTGSGINSELKSTSFLLWNADESDAVLFECGFSVFPELRKLELLGRFDFAKLNSVFLSHLHPDHSGSLGTLILKRGLMKLPRIKVMGVNPEIMLQETRGFEGCEYAESGDFELLPTRHAQIPSTGILIKGVLYSGDCNESL